MYRGMAAGGRRRARDQLKLIVLMVLCNLETPASSLSAEELLSATQDRLPN